MFTLWRYFSGLIKSSVLVHDNMNTDLSFINVMPCVMYLKAVRMMVILIGILVFSASLCDGVIGGS